MHVITTQAVNIQCWMVGAPIKNTSTNNRSCTPPRCSHLIWWMWFGARCCCCLWCRSCWCLPIAEEEEERRGKFKNFSSPQLHLPKTYKTLMTESNQHQQDIRKLVFSTPKSGVGKVDWTCEISERDLALEYWKLEKNWANGTFFRMNKRAAYTNFSISLRKIMEMSNRKEFFIGKIYVNIYVLSIPKGHPSIVIFNDTFFITFSVHIFLISQTIKRTCLQIIKINI